MTQNVPHFCRLWVWRFYDFPTGILTGIFVVCANKLILPFKTDCKTLSVTCGDSSPRGRAKAACNPIYVHKKRSASVIDTLHSLFYGHPSKGEISGAGDCGISCKNMGILSKFCEKNAISRGSSVIVPKKFYSIYFHTFMW